MIQLTGDFFTTHDAVTVETITSYETLTDTNIIDDRFKNAR